MNLHTLQPAKGSRHARKRVGRGLASRGTYSTRGMKGQRSRSGGKGGLKMKGMKQMLLRIPKVRGFKRAPDRLRAVVNVQDLGRAFSSGDIVTIAALQEKNLVPNKKASDMEVKVLGDGALSIPLTIEGCLVSATAKKKIEEAGGSLKV